MTVQAQAADGTIHEFPEGTDPSVVDRVMKAYATAPKQKPFGDDQDSSIPGAPGDPALRYKPSPPEPAMQHIGRALGEAFAGPYGPSPDVVHAFTQDVPVVSTLFRAGGTALDALGRPFTAGIRGGSAAAAEASKLVGNKEPEKLERDLNTLGDIGMLEMGQAPGVPRFTTNVGGALSSAAKTAAAAAKAPVAKGMNWFWDVDKFAKQNPETIALINKAEEQGARFPIGAWAPGAPYWSRLLQIAKGWNIDPVKEAAVPFYEKQAGKIMEQAGVPDAEGNGLTSATAAVDFKPAGEAVVDQATKSVADATSKLQTKIEAHETARAEAENAVKQGFETINKKMDAALSADQAQSGVLMREAAQQMRNLRLAVGKHFRQLYEAADQAADGETPNTDGLETWSKQLLDGLLPAVRDQFPREIKTLQNLSREEDEAPKMVPSGLVDDRGQPLMKAVEAAPKEPVTFGQLHELRSWVRHSIDWDDLAAGPGQGARKLLEKQIDQVLHDQEASPGLKAASKMLDEADAQYRQVIPRFRDTVVRQIVNSGSAAAPDNAAKLASMVITEGNTSRIGMVRDMVGPAIWNRVLAADLRSIVAQSMDETGQFSAQAFARKIMERNNAGMLAPAYGNEESAALVKQAQRVQQTYGKFDINALPGDTVTTLMQRAENAEKRAEQLAEQDAMGVFDRLSKHVDAVAKGMEAEGEKVIHSDLVNKLADLPAEKAAKKVLSEPDLFRAVVQRFGADSPAVVMLRGAWMRKFLQRPIDSTAKMADELGENTEEIQRILFPGSSLDDMITLTKQLKLMFPKGQDQTALGMAGQSMLQHPANASFFPHIVRKVLKIVPTGVARGVTSVTLNKISDVLTSPKLRRFITNGANGTNIQKDASRVAAFYVMSGAPPQLALAAGYEVLASQLHEPEPEPEPIPPRTTWRDRLKKTPGAGKGWRERFQQRLQNGE